MRSLLVLCAISLLPSLGSSFPRKIHVHPLYDLDMDSMDMMTPGSPSLFANVEYPNGTDWDKYGGDDDDDDDYPFDIPGDEDNDGSARFHPRPSLNSLNSSSSSNSSLNNHTNSAGAVQRRGSHGHYPKGGKHIAYGEGGSIPMRTHTCEFQEPPILLADVNVARERFVEWARSHSIAWGRWHGEVEGSAFWYVCYCKLKKPIRVKITPEELLEAQSVIEAQCHQGPAGVRNVTIQPGWVHSQNWHRIWNIMPRKHSHRVSASLCPKWCLRRPSLPQWMLMEP